MAQCPSVIAPYAVNFETPPAFFGKLMSCRLDVLPGEARVVVTLVFSYAVSSTRISTCKPAAAAMLTKASRLNRVILPRIRSETRGCVTPNN